MIDSVVYNVQIATFVYIRILVLALIFCYIPQYIHLVHQYRERNERKTEICEERSDDKDEEFIQLTGMVKDVAKSDVALAKKNVSDLFLELSGMVQNTDERHFETVKHVLKSTVAVKNTLATILKNVDIEKCRAAKKIFLNSEMKTKV